MNRRVFENTITEFQSFILEQAERFLSERSLGFDRELFIDQSSTDLSDLAREILCFGAGCAPEEALVA